MYYNKQVEQPEPVQQPVQQQLKVMMSVKEVLSPEPEPQPQSQPQQYPLGRIVYLCPFNAKKINVFDSIVTVSNFDEMLTLVQERISNYSEVEIPKEKIFFCYDWKKITSFDPKIFCQYLQAVVVLIERDFIEEERAKRKIKQQSKTISY